MFPRVGDQLELFADGEAEAKAYYMPWGGGSPRALTRGYEGLFLSASAKKSVSDPENWLACSRCGRPTKKGLRANARGPQLFLRRKDDHNG